MSSAGIDCFIQAAITTHKPKFQKLSGNFKALCTPSQLAYAEESLFDEKNNHTGTSSPRHWASYYKKVSFYGIHTTQASESLNNILGGHDMTREKCIPWAFHEMYAKVYQRAHALKTIHDNLHRDSHILATKVELKLKRLVSSADTKLFLFETDMKKKVFRVTYKHITHPVVHSISMVDYSCCWDCIGKNGNPCVEAVALCLYNNKDPHMLYPSCLTVDASYKLCNAAINKKYSPVIISSCKDLQILKVPVIPNHCCPAKGGFWMSKKEKI